MIYFREFLIVASLGLIGYGCYLIYVPASFIVVGGLLLFFAVLPTIAAMLRRGEG